MPSGTARRSSFKKIANSGKTRSKNVCDEISIVGPDNIQVLQGSLLGKQVALILCGESHEDAIDVTRKGALFEAKEGWIELTRKDELLDKFHNYKKGIRLDDAENDEDDCGFVVRIFSQTKKLQPVGKCMEWAKKFVQDEVEVVLGHVVLIMLWIQEDTREVRTTKGRAYVLGLASPHDLQEAQEDDDDSPYSERAIHLWKPPNELPTTILDWIQRKQCNKGLMEDSDNDFTDVAKEPQTLAGNVGGTSTKVVAYEWGDLDPEAFELNNRRLFEEDEISNEEYDKIINKRKIERRKENIWTFDDWFDHIRISSNPSDSDDAPPGKAGDDVNAESTSSHDSNIQVELILEASVPPWEVALHRPNVTDDEVGIMLPPANDCIRQVPSDEEPAIEDKYDPSSDGVGSYLDFIYRRFMDEMLEGFIVQHKSENDAPANAMLASNIKAWVHCVDARDMGCEAACHADSVKHLWDHILDDEELTEIASYLDGQRSAAGNQLLIRRLEAGSSKKYYKFLPHNMIHPEYAELQQLKDSELLFVDSDDYGESYEGHLDEEGLTFPSFEGFFGQNTDFLYYTPHIKLSYSPFLAKCVKSFSNWEEFFTKLFLGGTIPEAIDILDLDEGRDYVYVRSPIHKYWNIEGSRYEYRYRPDGEHYVSFPFFPLIFYLYAKGSSPPRTWSSDLFARLYHKDPATKEIAIQTQSWVLETIRHRSTDPKGSDDPQCGGEWFEAYLRAAHRDIYDDIDLFDSTVLLQKSKIKSLTSARKYNIGKIKIPSCQEGFQEILSVFNRTDIDEKNETRITASVEVMAKILIDIFMSSLVDYATILKIVDIVSNSSDRSKVAIVCYMGSAHTRAVKDFYTKQMGFTPKVFVGKHDWQENEPRSLNLPQNLWDVRKLFH